MILSVIFPKVLTSFWTPRSRTTPPPARSRPSGTTIGVPVGGTVIIVIVPDVWVASADCWLVLMDPKVAWKSLLLLLFLLLLVLTITLLTWLNDISMKVIRL